MRQLAPTRKMRTKKTPHKLIEILSSFPLEIGFILFLVFGAVSRHAILSVILAVSIIAVFYMKQRARKRKLDKILAASSISFP